MIDECRSSSPAASAAVRRCWVIWKWARQASNSVPGSSARPIDRPWQVQEGLLRLRPATPCLRCNWTLDSRSFRSARWSMTASKKFMEMQRQVIDASTGVNSTRRRRSSRSSISGRAPCAAPSIDGDVETRSVMAGQSVGMVTGTADRGDCPGTDRRGPDSPCRSAARGAVNESGRRAPGSPPGSSPPGSNPLGSNPLGGGGARQLLKRMRAIMAQAGECRIPAAPDRPS